MSSGYSSKTWACPFFKWDEKQKVHCEGGVVSLWPKTYDDYTNAYCASVENWQKCSLAVYLVRQYDKEVRS